MISETPDTPSRETTSRPSERRAPPEPDRFRDIDCWVFDLDNTLYPPSCNLFAQVDTRMGEYIRTLLNVDHEEARRLQKTYYRDYGTTLRGLMTRHGVEPADFLAYVHDIDVSPVAPDQLLEQAIARLPGRRLVLTNGSRAHADNVLSQLGLGHLFEDIFDIANAGYLPKPMREAYDGFITRLAVEPSRAAMFEDLAHNLECPHLLGMTTILVRPYEGAGHDDHLFEPGEDKPHVDYVTSDLPGFLKSALPGG